MHKLSAPSLAFDCVRFDFRERPVNDDEVKPLNQRRNVNVIQRTTVCISAVI